MKKTTNYGLALYDKEDNMIITAEENSLNANMKIIDKTLKEKATINDMTNYIEEHKEELKGADGKDYVLTETDKEDISKLVEVNIPTKVSELENDKNYLNSIPLEYVTDNELSEKGYATESFVTNKIAEAELSGSEVDLSGLATKDELASKVDKVKGKSLIDDTEIERLANVINYNDTELRNSINSKADKTELHNHNNKAVLDNITAENIENWNNKSEFDGNYNSLSNKPTIPNKVSELENDKNYITSIPSEYVTETELNNKGYLTEHQDLSSYAKRTEIPTKVSELDNDENYLTAIPSEYITETELSAKGYLTSIPSEYVTDTELNAKKYLTSVPSDYKTKTENDSLYQAKGNYLTSYTETDPTVPSHVKNIKTTDISNWNSKSTFSGSYNDLTNKPTLFSGNYNDLTNKPTIPTKTSQLTNDSGYLTEVPTITEQNITNALGYKPVSPFSVWENVECEVVTGKAVTRTGYVNSVSSGKYIKVKIDNYSSLKITGYQWDTKYNYALCIFLNKSDAVISYVSLTSGTQYTNYEVAVPSEAVSVIVNGNSSNALGLSGLKEYNFKTLSEEKANRIARWVVPTIEIKEKYIISTNGKSEQEFNNGELGVVVVSDYKKVKVSGYQYDLSYGYDLCCFYDLSGNLISSHQGTTSATKAVLELEVPNNAVTLKVSGQKYEGKVSVEGYQVFDVEDLYEALRPSGKKLITLGDSITALGTGSTGWVKYFIEKTGCQLIANVAVNGATLHDKSGTTYDGNPVFEGTDNNVNNVLGNQVQKIINNEYEAPDIIMIAIGTNAGISITREQMKSVYYDSSNALIPLENVDRTTSAGAYRWCLDKLHATYPNAIIFWCTPIHGFQTTRSAENITAYAESLRIATEYTGQIMIDTIRCGINGINELKNANGQYLVDGLHPNVNGAKKIGYYNASKVLPFIGNNFTLQ